MPFVRFVDPFQPQTQRRCGPAYGRCGRQQQSSRQASNPIIDFFSALEKEFAAPSEQLQTPKAQPKKTINPNFDVFETDASYIIQADLPGVQDKKSVDIEFTDAQTLVVKGEISRRQLFKPTVAASTVERLNGTEEQLPVYSESSSNSTSSSSSDTASTHSHQPTVEETVDESGSENEFEVVDSPSTLKTASVSASPAPAPVSIPTPESATQKEASSEPQQQAEPSQQQQAPKEKFWLNERSTGVFDRTFKFEQLIDQDTVTASLEYGVLEIVVPKREKYVRRVQIQ